VTKARISVKRNPKTVDEQLNYLQEQIDDTRRDLREEISDLDRKFQERSKAIDEKIGLLLASLKQVESNVAEVSVGGIEFQVFGVLLVIYGAIAGYTV
jgi:type I site-specific restriction endonuclease